MTYQEKDHPRGEAGRWEAKHQSEAEGVSLAPAAKVLPKPIMARAILQRWGNGFDPDAAMKIGEVEFDAAPILAGMMDTLDEDELEGFMELETLDQIYHEAEARGLVPPHYGPFEVVDVDSNLQEALAEDPSRFDTPYPHELVPRHKEAVLMSPLSAYELGARVDEDNIVEALAIVDQEDMVGASEEAYSDTISKKITGSELLMDPQATAVNVTPEGLVVYRISGDATEVINTMTDEQAEQFEAGRAAAS